MRTSIGTAVLAGAASGVAGAAVMAGASKLEQRFTHRPDSYIPAHTLARLIGLEVRALHDRCSHRGCSLAEGEVEGEEIVCGCHFSRFSLVDGSVRRGPAVAQPAFDVRWQDGIVEVRLRESA